MATWNVTINQIIDESSAANKALQRFTLLENYLYTNWTLLAYGDGSTTFTKNAAGITPNPFPTYPAITGGTVDTTDDAWAVFENADGCQVVIQADGYYIRIGFTVDGDYLASPGPWDDATNSDRPGSTTPPTDELLPDSDSFYQTSDYYMSIAMSADNNSFIFFSGNVHDSCCALIKLEETKTGDDHPYWLYLYNGGDTFSDSYISASSGEHTVCYHPIGGQQRYPLARPYSANTDVMDSMLADPFTGYEQLVEGMCVCVTAPYNHIRGRVPGFWRNSGNRSQGDTFDGGNYMCMGDWTLPWDGTTTALQ